MDGMIAIRHPGDEELGRRLAAYAEARLSPDVAAMDRTRARLVARAAARPAAAASASAGRGSSWTGGGSRVPRIAAAMLAAALVIGLVAGTALAARPGGPLYAVRLWVETATLPTDPAARSAADLAHLQARLADVDAAAAAGDHRGVTAALDAYRATIDDAIAADPGSDEALKVALSRHLVVLRTLAESVPEEARPAMERAIAASGGALQRIEERRPPGGRGPGSVDGPGGKGPSEPPGTSKPAGTPEAGKPDNPPRQTKPDMTPYPNKPSEPPRPSKP